MRRLLILAALALPAPAVAQTRCMPASDMADWLGKHGEHILLRGTVGPTAAYGIWVDEEDGSWTIVRYSPDGLACALAYGFDAEIIETKPGVPG